MAKTIMITGANRGIGEILTRRLHDRGDDVIAHGRDREALAALGCRTVVADLSRPHELADAVAGIDRLDVLVHNAGIAEAGPVSQLDVECWQRQLTVNLVAPAELTRALLPALRAAHGHVVFVNSGAGLAASPMFAAYAASKHGLKALADALRAEEQHHSVRVTTIHPSIVATDMQRELRDSLGGPYDPDRAMRPESVVDAIVATIDIGGTDAVVNDLRIAPPVPFPHPTRRP
jgi:NAD(P)-dependent dehydrogenase (short-subunit alcohol dehydrogenase family)